MVAGKLLLDTHIWLWTLLEPDRLRDHVADALRHPANQLWLSPISIWETLLLVERGRIELAAPVQVWIADAQEAFPVRDAVLNRDIARASRRIELPSEDPADRFLAATAIVHDLTLVTEDDRLVDAADIPTLSNR